MEIPFALSAKKDGALGYRIHPIFSLASLAIALVILAAGTLTAPAAPAAIAISVIALAGALYTESWVFDGRANTVTHKTGFFPFLKKYQWATGSSSSVRLSVFAKGELDQGKAEALLEKAEKGGTFRGFFPFAPETALRIRLILETGDGETVLVDEAGLRDKARLAALASRIASQCGIAFADK